MPAKTNLLQDERYHNNQTVGSSPTSPTKPKFCKKSLIQCPEQRILVSSAPPFLKRSMQPIGNYCRAMVWRDEWYVVGFQRPQVPKVHQRAHPCERHSAQDTCVGLAADALLRRRWRDCPPSQRVELPRPPPPAASIWRYLFAVGDRGYADFFFQWVRDWWGRPRSGYRLWRQCSIVVSP